MAAGTREKLKPGSQNRGWDNSRRRAFHSGGVREYVVEKFSVCQGSD
jgi:hypothetical protein